MSDRWLRYDTGDKMNRVISISTSSGPSASRHIHADVLPDMATSNGNLLLEGRKVHMDLASYGACLSDPGHVSEPHHLNHIETCCHQAGCSSNQEVGIVSFPCTQDSVALSELMTNLKAICNQVGVSNTP